MILEGIQNFGWEVCFNPQTPHPCTPLHGQYLYFASDTIVMNFTVFCPLYITYFCGFSGIEIKKKLYEISNRLWPPLKNTQRSFNLPLISIDFISTGFPWCTSIPIVFHWRTFWPAFRRTVCCFHSPSRVIEGQRYSLESLIDWHWSFWA